MREWDVVICDVIEEMDFVLVEEETSRNRMHWSVAPSLVEKSTVLVERLEEIDVSF